MIVTETQAIQTGAATLRQDVVTHCVNNDSNFTDLPASLVEDLISVMTKGMMQVDAIGVEAINSVAASTMHGATLHALGQERGLFRGEAVNTAVYVRFTGDKGMYIEPGLTVTDGAHQYYTQHSTVLDSTGVSPLVYCYATEPGAWAIPTNSVDAIATSVPKYQTLTCTNPSPGIPGESQETTGVYRERVIAAGLGATGSPNYLKSELLKIPGVQERLVDIRPDRIIVGGGDNFLVAGAIAESVLHFGLLGSEIDSNRDIITPIKSLPDIYKITYINPPLQRLGLRITWNSAYATDLMQTSIAALAAPNILTYINSIKVRDPLNVDILKEIFIDSVVSILPKPTINRLLVDVYIDGVLTPLDTGKNTVSGDIEGYFYANDSDIEVVRG